MSDTTISFGADTTQAEGKLKRLKRQAQDTGKAFGAAQAGAIAGRMGGVGGGMASRFIGGGAIGAGVAGAGLALNAFLAADERRVMAARAREENRMRIDTARGEGVKGRQSLNAGALSSQQVVSRLVTRGTAGMEYQPDELAKRRGISAFVAADALLTGQDTGVSADQIAWLMATGEFSSTTEAAEAIQSGGGVTGALAMKRNISSADADRQLDATMSFAGSAIGKARSADSAIFNQQFGALTTGATAEAVTAQTNATLNPEQTSLAAAREEIDRNVTVLLAAAQAQGKLAAALQTVGEAIGMGNGSAGSQASKAIAATTE
jgi:hypothetical protein